MNNHRIVVAKNGMVLEETVMGLGLHDKCVEVLEMAQREEPAVLFLALSNVCDHL